MKRHVYSFVVMACCFMAATSVMAHPHAWIDLKTKLIFSDDGKLKALRLHWAFDEFYSVYTIEVLDPDKDGKINKKNVMDLARQNLKNLQEYNYFIEVKADNDIVKLGEVTDYDSTFSNGILTLDFTVPLETAVDPKVKNISYAVFDPTYYIEILYDKKSPISFSDNAPESCRTNLTEPSPTVEMMTLAASLDKTQSAGNSLGRVFAQTVFLQCIQRK